MTGVLTLLVGGCTPFSNRTVEIRVLVNMNVCVQVDCVTVPLSRADVTLTRQTEATLRKTADASGKATFDVSPDVGEVIITAESPLLSRKLTATTDVAPQDVEFISLEMADPIPAQLNRRPQTG
jgi:hypothetical protein